MRRGLFRRVKEDEIRELAQLIGELAARSPGFSRGALKIHIIASPAAGVLQKQREVEENIARLRTVLLSTSRDLLPNGEAKIKTDLAQGLGHPRSLGAEIAGEMIHEGREASPRLILSMGGDGTHLEILSSLLDLPEDLRKKITVFRLPLGTGNDGADAGSMTEAARIFLLGASPKELEAIKISPRNSESFYAFNIVSLGIDAFVSRMSNLLKGKLPGDSYKLAANAATLLYRPLYGADPMELELYGDGQGPHHIRGRYLLAAFGVSGGRTYGNKKKILPGEENLCVIRNRSLRQIIALKPLLFSGRHIREEGVEIRKARGINISYGRRIWLQTDGEDRIMGPENFPCRMDVIKTGIFYLQEKM